jgi:hypothetical protein
MLMLSDFIRLFILDDNLIIFRLLPFAFHIFAPN